MPRGIRILMILIVPILLAACVSIQPVDNRVFVDRSDKASITSTHQGIWDENAPVPYDNGYLAAGMAWSDFDNDGWVDLFVTGNLDPNVLSQQPGRYILGI